MDSHPPAHQRIYLDHAATTPVRPEVAAAMAPFLSERAGNPSSLHLEGRRAREALEMARQEILDALGGEGFELVFTAGGTEADNAALLSWALRRESAGGRIVTSAVEHPAVLGTRPVLERLGVELVEVPVDAGGRVDEDRMRDLLAGPAGLVSVMAANNETGVLEPVAGIGAFARDRGILVHTDAVQCLGKLELGLRDWPVDLVTLSAHKVHGPKGVGALLVRRDAPFTPFLRGGGQEHRMRAGTENVAGAVGFAAAVRLAEAERPDESRRLARMTGALRKAIEERFDGVVVNTPREEALPGILNVSFPGVEGQSLVKRLDRLGVAVSTGSACSSGSGGLSHVLLAMGRTEREVRGSIRFSLGRGNREGEIPALLARLEEAVGGLQALSGTGPRVLSREPGV